MGLREGALGAYKAVIDQAEPLAIRVPQWDSEGVKTTVYVYPAQVWQLSRIEAEREKGPFAMIVATVIARCCDEAGKPVFRPADAGAMYGDGVNAAGCEPEVLSGIVNRIKRWDTERLIARLREAMPDSEDTADLGE